MTGRILIVDEGTTNRIVLKARLSAAFYEVMQAADLYEALDIAINARPDLILLGTPLAETGLSLVEFTTRLTLLSPAPAPRVLVLLDRHDPQARLRALQDGAADVMLRDAPKPDFFARTRALLRHHHAECELVARSGNAEMLGLAEEASTFTVPERVLVISDDATQAEALCQEAAPYCSARLSSYSENADVTLLCLSGESERTSLRRIAELQAAPQNRGARLMVRLDEALSHLTAPILDMGVVDVLPASVTPAELGHRLNAQLASKRRADQMWGRLEHGLHAAMTDPLTGLHNRRYAQATLRRMADTAAATGDRIAIMMADIDHFKAVNDRYGHATGDQVLSGVAKVMQAALPSEALIARMGGEEFLIATPAPCPDEARHVASRMCRVVREARFPLGESDAPVAVTVSIGVALSPTGSEINSDALIAQADKALYASKSGGRDTITLRPAA